MSRTTEWGSDEQRLGWDHEYKAGHIIPSSTRRTPAKALLLYDQLIDYPTLTPILDAGCGNGRNACHVASKGCAVVAADFSEKALDATRQLAAETKVAARVRAVNTRLRDRWEFHDAQFGMVLDSYVFCHVLDGGDQTAYRQELHRVLRPGGLLYSAVFSTDDSYYCHLAGGTTQSGSVVLDPLNGFRKFLYSEEQFLSFFAATFRIVNDAIETVVEQ